MASKSTTVWNGEVGYRLSGRARLVIEAFNLFDAKVSDIDYFYASRLPGEPLVASKTSISIRRSRGRSVSGSSSRFELVPRI